MAITVIRNNPKHNRNLPLFWQLLVIICAVGAFACLAAYSMGKTADERNYKPRSAYSRMIDKQLADYERARPKYCNDNTQKCNAMKMAFLFEKE